jgi:hypothetical protein
MNFDPERLPALVETVSRSLAELRTLAEARDAKVKVDALLGACQRARQAIDSRVKREIIEASIRLDRRIGELLGEMKESKEIRRGGKGRNCRGTTTIKNLGITRDLSSKAQAIADIPTKEFEHALHLALADGHEPTRILVDKALRPIITERKKAKQERAKEKREILTLKGQTAQRGKKTTPSKNRRTHRMWSTSPPLAWKRKKQR